MVSGYIIACALLHCHLLLHIPILHFPFPLASLVTAHDTQQCYLPVETHHDEKYLLRSSLLQCT